MTFRRQLFVGQIAAIVITILTGVVAIVALNVIVRDASAVTSRFVQEVRIAQQLRLQCERLVAASRGYLLSGEERYRARFRALARDIDSSLDDVRAHAIGAPARGDLERIEKGTEDYVTAVRSAAYERTRTEDPRPFLAVFDDLESKREAFVRDIDTFTHRKESALDASIAQSAALARGATIAMELTTLIAIAICVLLAQVVRRNVTEQFDRAQAATEKAKQAATARDELLSVVAHDLRAPLTAVALGAQSLIDKGVPSARELHIIAGAAERMRHLVDELLDVSRIETGAIALHRAIVPVDRLFEEISGLFQGQATAALVDLRTEPHAESVCADHERVIQILSNLVTNALNVVPRGGSITVAADRSDHLIRFAVSDTGPGVAQRDVPRLFDRRWQADRGKTRGLGLGLYICKRLVEAHGGRIGVESKVGAGSTFWFELGDPEPERREQA
ncbi:MAG TPA: ATP-binding protein [Kofleriaceae bacterium]|jgi:signal transduction histidine kinase